ncbi:MAG: type I glyceraldehyde-3-phosphate dehydrogenase [Candidatus Omnitrophica bacterium]|nr:type I glyceraldehyde-3-phosphate dehydrogenase [Candidatus Omnitrophota bacterium]
MAIKVGINGFGRIGRNVYRAAMGNKEIEIVAVNDLPLPTETLSHLLKYDSVLGNLDADVKAGENSLSVNGKTVQVLTEKSPADIPWDKYGVEVVIESTGVFTDANKAKDHIKGSVKKVIISAPAKNEDVTIVLGVNEGTYDAQKHNVISNASCTTNCLAPMAKVILDNFGIKSGLMTTIHSYTNDQRILDLAHKDLRRARAAAVSMIPTSTGAAKAIGLVIPQLKGKLDGLAIRVPTPNVSLTDLTVQTEKATSAEEVNAALKKASQGAMGKYLEFCEEPLVSKDFNGNPHSCVVDADLTRVIDGTQVKVLGWYDNEWAYSCRVVDLIQYIFAKQLQAA